MDISKFVNTTPHAINVSVESVIYTIPQSGMVSRLVTTETPAGEVGGVKLVTRKCGEVCNLPTLEAGQFWLVSAMVLDSAPAELASRMVAPDTGATCIRDESGRIMAVTQFITA